MILNFTQFLSEKKGTTGSYVALNFSTASVKRIAQYVKDNDIPNPLAASKLHVTLMYSRVEMQGFKSPGNLIEPIIATVSGFDVWNNADMDGKALVVTLDAPALVERHLMLMKLYGASYDFPEYKPHFTISYNVPNEFDPQTLPAFGGNLFLDHEYNKRLDLDWRTTKAD